MKKFFCLVSAALLLVACNEKPGYKITGTVSNPELNGKYIYLYEYGVKDVLPLDSALVENNKFSFKGEQASAALRTLRFSDGVIDMKKYQSQGGFPAFAPWFVLDNSNLTVSVDVNSAVNGSPENNDLTAYMQKLDNIFDDMKAYSENEQEKAEAEYEEARNKANVIHKEYIKTHNNTLSGAAALINNRHSLSEEERRQLLSTAGETFKSFPGIDKMEQHLVTLEKVAIGKKFTDFEMADTKGTTRKLSDYVGNGKVVLIDFWASWCPPCRRDMPHLVELYKQYKNKNFEIVGISLDSKQDAWEKGIKDLSITWPQLSDLKGWQNSGAALYGVNSIPHTVLVNGDGTIIAKNLRGKALDLKLEEVLK